MLSVENTEREIIHLHHPVKQFYYLESMKLLLFACAQEQLLNVSKTILPAISISLSSKIPKNPWHVGGQPSTADRSPKDSPIN